MIYYWDIVGVFFFAVSGALAGRQQGMDLWGVFLLALVTAVGGGTLRSILIGDVPVAFLTDPAYVITIAIACICGILFPELWLRLRRAVSVVDAFGLGIFACIGTQIALAHGLEWWAAAGLGVISATFGGVIRDVLRNEVPLILRKEIYATAALGGAFLLMGLNHLGVPEHLSILIATIATAAVRLISIRYAVNQSSL